MARCETCGDTGLVRIQNAIRDGKVIGPVCPDCKPEPEATKGDDS